MPSSALLKFQGNLLVDVDRIIHSHAILNHDGGGRRGLGHITRSGVFMLCAAWELYVEEVGLEIATLLAQRANAPSALPQRVQKTLAKFVREHKHDLKPLELAGAGWESVYVGHVREVLGGLNTPKAGPIEEIYERLLGWGSCGDHWSCGRNTINDFVKARGDIAHRGRDTDYVNIRVLRDYRTTIFRTVVEHDNAAADFVQANSVGNSPWRRRAV